MKKLLLLFVSAILISSCDENEKNSVSQRVLPDSNGRINALTVVMDNELWEGSVGNAVRDSLAKPVDGLPQDEPLFEISHLPTKTFSGFATKSRTILIAQKGAQNRFAIDKDVYAKPQRVAVLEGQTEADIVRLIHENADRISEVFKEGEVTETMRRIHKSLHGDESLKENLKIDVPIPTAYRFAVSTPDFFWIRKDIPQGHMNLLAYELPHRTFNSDSEVLDFIIRTRDSIGAVHIPGRLEGSHLITEEAYAPFLNESMISGRKCWETKGTWEVKNDFMAGPYVSYLIDDVQNNRLVVLEGFVFKPSNEKRDNVFELESILKSSKFL
jgi:hypothetical protein